MRNVMSMAAAVNWEESWATVFTGLIVVFVALIGLVLLVWVLSKLLGAAIHEKKPAPQEAPKVAPVAPLAPAPQVVEVVTDDMGDELVAAITAAVNVLLSAEGDGKSYVVKSVKRVRSGGSAWAQAGVLENTRPF